MSLQGELFAFSRTAEGVTSNDVLLHFVGEDRKKLRAFLIHYAKRGPDIVPKFVKYAEEKSRGGGACRIGNELFRNHGRDTVKGWGISNNYVPFYVAIVRDLLPDLERLIICKARLPQELLKHWHPTLEGGVMHEGP